MASFMNKYLTIVIPTYNRENQLIRLLRSIENQNAIDKYSIVILNNNSDYSVETSIGNHFSGSFLSNIEVYNRPYNSGGDYNISSAFLFAKSQYLWIIGDDDEVVDGCFDIIEENINKKPDCPIFKYMIKGYSFFNEDVTIANIEEFEDCYKKRYFTSGDIIFVSNNIYNLDLLKESIPISLYYSYSSIPQSLQILYCIVTETPFILSCKEIVKYNEPDGDHWNYTKISTSFSTILDINIDDKYDVVRRFFSVISNHFEIVDFLNGCFSIDNKQYRKYVSKKCVNTLFSNRGISRYFVYYLFCMESMTGLKVFSVGYVASVKFLSSCDTKVRVFFYPLYRMIKKLL